MGAGLAILFELFDSIDQTKKVIFKAIMGGNGINGHSEHEIIPEENEHQPDVEFFEAINSIVVPLEI
ncbi:hypothetical protein OK016_18535 [Vibrio chagasii]|nr:hypothetical protein [Vibrio chagasii]